MAEVSLNESYAAITSQSMHMKNNPSYALSHTNATRVNPDSPTTSQDRYAIPADPLYDAIVEEDEEHSYVIV